MDKEDDEKPARHIINRPLLVGFAISLFLLVLGANWAVEAKFGSDMPNWDQWDAEGIELLVPWFKGDHFVQHLFHAQNEHRVVLTKLQNLTLLLLGGQWDARVQCVTNGMLHAAIASACWIFAVWWLYPALMRNRGAQAGHLQMEPALLCGYAFLLTAALFGLPISWQNLVSGFHSQQYWLTGLSIVAICLFPWARPFRMEWWASAGIAVMALFSMASGMFAALTVVVLVVVRRFLPASDDSAPIFRTTWPTLLVSAAIVFVGFATRVSVSYHEPLKAHSAHDFILSVVRSLAWPVRDHDWIGIVIWLPWLAVAAYVLAAAMRPARSHSTTRSDIGERSALSIFGIGGWVLAQFVATAYARGAGGDYPQPRYMDTTAVGAWINGVALVWVATYMLPRHIPWRAMAFAALVGWSTTMVVGLHPLVADNLHGNLPYVRNFYREAEAHLRGYLATNDPAELAFEHIPYPSAGTLVERLQHSVLREHMPVSVRPPLPMAPQQAIAAGKSSGGFVENYSTELRLASASHRGEPSDDPVLASIPTWGSFNATGPRNTAEWQSTPMTAPLHGWLKFEVAGDLGISTAKLSLELRDASSHALLATVSPSRISGDSWRAVYVRAPRRAFVVEARDDDANHWFAFSAPVEMSGLSYWSWQAAKQGLIVLGIGVVAGIGLTAIGLWQAKVRPNP